MKLYYVYILSCNDQSLYVGFTSDINNRLMEHNAGKYSTGYTYTRIPVKLVFYQPFIEPAQAIIFEKKIKKWSRAKKQALIDENFDQLQNLAECRNATHHNYDPRKDTDGA